MKHLMRALISSCRTSRRHVAAIAVVLVAFVGLAAPGCSSSDTPASKLFTNCTLNSDCNSGLLCTLGQCRPKCKTVADCDNGGSCVFDNAGHAVCQSPKENNTPCDPVAMPCTPPLACASDFRCRNLCVMDSDCNVLGITGRVCATDAKGTHYCADPAVPGEVTGGKITQPPPPGAGESPDGGNTGSNDATMGGQDGTTGGQDAPMTGTDGTGGGEASQGTTCTPACGVNFQCVAGACTSCGKVAGDPCCGTTCGANLTCSGGTCQCGKPGQACCSGTMCSNNVTCVSSMCACGGAGQACCPASGEGGAASSCTTPLQCAGINCSCLVGCSGNVVQRTDGSLWTSPTVPVTTGTGAKFLATAFASGNYITCGVQSDGSAWCWGSNNYGQLGNGTTMNSTLPVKVTTDASGTALANVAKVFVDTYSGNSACAIDKTGAAWCWGYGYYGQLGTGYTNNSLFAIPVALTAGGAQLTGVDHISIANDHACAKKTDGTAWCWGSNSYGQIGVGANPMTTMQFLNPVQVTALFTNVVNITAGGQVTCATTNDGNVWCWGNNSQGILGNGLNTGFADVPAQVMLSGDAGGNFTGASQVELMYYGYAACALKTADRSLWCWGNYSSAQKYFPVPYTEQSFPISSIFLLCGDQPNSNSPSFIDAKGAYHQSGSASTSQVTCQ